MPVYCFRTIEDDELVELRMSYAELDERKIGDGKFKLRDGREARVDFRAQHANPTPPGCWPKESLALGVHTSQIGEAQEHYRNLGIEAHFNSKTGAMKIPDRSFQNNVLKKTGQMNHDAGYGDFTGRTQREIKDAFTG